MSNIRLDGYIYTVQSMQSAFRLLNDNGVLSLSFMAGHEWLARKLVRMVALATNQMPITVGRPAFTGDLQVMIWYLTFSACALA